MKREELNIAVAWIDNNVGPMTAIAFHKAMDSYINTETSKQLSEEMTREIVKQIKPLFEKCLANVNPDTREEVRRNMGAVVKEPLTAVWHKASEELPKEEGMYFVWIPEVGVPAPMYWIKCAWQNHLSDAVTYWMPIPELPKEENK